ncbi:pyridoxamine 5'-phosphate oxidase family protein [Noviherbaspirillum cavernae]|uniref:Pyridoxamine 5'-phosphate oxidase family protein n=1 Tax=Noviherbaspirillum cavernae TaxID=2320862 RepID=A0A418X5M9_9BURK|nr:pyridoxamine 5'-phosphate oxidase family protein [Noviherbaspirillum cavernae]RJG07739.1 pyridoxamine 5'-phosphate oxidase family protein [Noviherbaspirillum cavernae]
MFGAPGEASLLKERDHIDASYRALIEASPFLALATCGPHGMDCSPRGDPRGLVRVRDEKTIILPDRRGNNRLDSLRNVVHNPQLALLFLIPGLGETVRVNGRAVISADPALLAEYEMDGKLPKVALVITVDAVYFQCSRAVLRAELWNPARHADPSTLPTPGRILAEASASRIDAARYDRELAGRIKDSLY